VEPMKHLTYVVKDWRHSFGEFIWSHGVTHGRRQETGVKQHRRRWTTLRSAEALAFLFLTETQAGVYRQHNLWTVWKVIIFMI